MEVEKVLTELGLSPKEVRVYLVLLEMGHAEAAKAARMSGLPRQTTYSLLAGLVEKGFIEQSDKRGVRRFFADPNRLLALVESKRDELTAKKKVLQQELPRILAKRKADASLPIVQYYEGEVGLERLFENMLEQHKGKAKTFRGYGINQIPGGTFGEFLRSFIKKRNTLNVTTKLFVANAPDNFGITDEGSALGRDVKRVNVDEQQAGIYMVGDRVYLFSYRDNVGVMVENRAIATYLKDVFDTEWNKS